MGNWTVILHGNRGKTIIYNGLSVEAAQRLFNTAIFINKDCINGQCFCVES